MSMKEKDGPLDSSFKEDPPSKTKVKFLQRVFPTGFKHEFVELLKYSWPIVIAQFLNAMIRVTVIMFAGHLGKLQLGGATMAISLANLIGNSISIGLIAACDTYFSQSFGSPNKFQVGIYLQTAICISFLCCVVSFAVILNTQNILLHLGQDPLISLYAEQFIHIFIPALLFIALYQLMTRYLIIQGIVFPSICVGLLANGFNALLQYIFIEVLNLGLQGSALGIISGYCTMGVGISLYIYCSKVYRSTWAGWSKQSLIEWGPFLKLGLSSIMMISIEWWTFEISFFLMGLIGAVELGASSVLYQLYFLSSQFAKGTGSASAYRVGKYLGAGRVKGAITATRVAMIFAVFLALFFAVLFLCLRHHLPIIFTSDQDVINLATEMLPILALFSFFGTIKGLCAGIVRGLGKQVIGGCVTFVAFVLCALPIGIPLMFYTTLRAAGFWWGLNIGLAIACVSLLIVVFTVNWEAEAEKALKRTKCKTKRKKEHSLLEDSANKELSYGSIEISISGVDNHSSAYWRKLIINRVIVVSLCFAIFAFGLVCRFVIFIPLVMEPVTNSTLNYTQLKSDIIVESSDYFNI